MVLSSKNKVGNKVNNKLFHAILQSLLIRVILEKNALNPMVDKSTRRFTPRLKLMKAAPL